MFTRKNSPKGIDLSVGGEANVQRIDIKSYFFMVMKQKLKGPTKCFPSKFIRKQLITKKHNDIEIYKLYIWRSFTSRLGMTFTAPGAWIFCRMALRANFALSLIEVSSDLRGDGLRK